MLILVAVNDKKRERERERETSGTEGLLLRSKKASDKNNKGKTTKSRVNK